MYRKSIPSNLNCFFVNDVPQRLQTKNPSVCHVNRKIWVEHPAGVKKYTVKIQIRNILGEIPQNLQEQPFQSAKWSSAQMSRIYPWNNISQSYAARNARQSSTNYRPLNLKTMNSWSEGYTWNLDTTTSKWKSGKLLKEVKPHISRNCPCKCKPKKSGRPVPKVQKYFFFFWFNMCKPTKILNMTLNQKRLERVLLWAPAAQPYFVSEGKGIGIELFHRTLHSGPRLSTDQGGIEPSDEKEVWVACCPFTS